MIRSLLIIVLIPLNLILWGVPVMLLGIVKLLLPGGEPRRKLRLLLSELGDRWSGGNDLIFNLLLDTKWDISGVDGLRMDGHYLIVSNHVSWLDIFVLQRAFHRRVAFMRFFIKQQLIWFPILGQACWAMDFPFMRRYTPEYLERHPEKRGKDLESTRRTCRRYRRIPMAILNFVEGTRFTRAKQLEEKSPYRNLLRPRVGGIAFVLASLGELLDGVVDVTIRYPRPDVTFWEFITNRVGRVVVGARLIEVPAQFVTEPITEPGAAREAFKIWIESLWREKDEILDQLAQSS